MELARPPPLDEPEERDEQERQGGTTAEAVADRRLHDHEDESETRLVSVLVREEPAVGADDERVEGDGDVAEHAQAALAVRIREPEEQERPGRERRGDVPGARPVSLGEDLREVADLEGGERDTAETYPRDPTLDRAEAVSHERPSARAPTPHAPGAPRRRRSRRPPPPPARPRRRRFRPRRERSGAASARRCAARTVARTAT